MATTKKKSTTSKAPAKRKPAAARKAPVKTTPSKRSLLRSHIGLRPEEADFMTFRITKQTLYWLVLGVVVVMFTLWLARLQSDIQDLYDQIDANTAEMSTF